VCVREPINCSGEPSCLRERERERDRERERANLLKRRALLPAQVARKGP